MGSKGKERAHRDDRDDTIDNAASLADLRDRLVRGESDVSARVAWSPATGLLAYPAHHARTPYFPGQQLHDLPRSPSVALVLPHPTGTPTRSLTLALPALSREGRLGHEHIHRLSFSPDGGLLVVWTLFEPELVVAAASSSAFGHQGASTSMLLEEPYRQLRMVIFERGDCLNTWTLTLDWDASRARGTSAPAISRIVDMTWLSTASTSDLQARFGEAGISFLAILDTQECLLFRRPHCSNSSTSVAPNIIITSLDKPFSSDTDLYMAGLNLPGGGPVTGENMVTVDGSVIPNTVLPGTLPPPTPSTSRLLPRRTITHGSSSTSSPLPLPESRSAASRVLVAYKSRLVPQNLSSASVNHASGSGMLETSPSAGQPLPPVTTSLATKMFDDPYGEVNLAALDDLFDTDMSGDPSNQSLYRSALAVPGSPQKGAVGNKSTGRSPGSKSPSKSIMGSPRKQGGGKGLPNEGGEGASPGVLPENERLQGSQRDYDEEGGKLQLWEVQINWDSLSISTHPVALVPLSDPLSDKHSEHHQVTHLHFLPRQRVSAGEKLLATLLPASDASPTTAVTFDITQQPFQLSDAFSTLEGRKKDPASFSASEIGTEWAVHRRTEGSLATTVLDVLPSRHGPKVIHLHCTDASGQSSLKTVHSESWKIVLETHMSSSVSSSGDPPFLALALSPSENLAVAVAFRGEDVTQSYGQPAIFAISSETSKMDGGPASNLGARLAMSLIWRDSNLDILVEIQKKDEDSRRALIDAVWSFATSMLKGMRPERSHLLLPLISLTGSLLPSTTRIATGLIDLIATMRILQESKTVLRKPVPIQQGQQEKASAAVAEIFDQQAVWQIIGHISSVFRYWDDLIERIAGASDAEFQKEWSSLLFPFIHPVARSLQQRLIRLIARFTNYIVNTSAHLGPSPHLQSLTPNVLDLEIARSVLSDLILSNRTKTQELGSLMHSVPGRLSDEWQKGEDRARETLRALRLSEDCAELATSMRETVREKLVPLVRRQADGKRKRSYDGVTKAVILEDDVERDGRRRRTCVSCGAVSREFVESGAGTEWEASKRRACICGGIGGWWLS